MKFIPSDPNAGNDARQQANIPHLAKVEALCADAHRLVAAGDAKEAWGKYLEALALVPEPKTNRKETTTIPTGIGNAAFLRKSFSKAKAALENAVRCPDGLGDAFTPIAHSLVSAFISPF